MTESKNAQDSIVPPFLLPVWEATTKFDYLVRWQALKNAVIAVDNGDIIVSLRVKCVKVTYLHFAMRLVVVPSF